MGHSRSPLAEEVLLRHAGLVRSVARALVDRELAEDVVQDTMLAALRRPPGQADRIRGWMARVARNLALKARRGRARRFRREQATARVEAAPSAAEVAARLETEARLVAAIRAVLDNARAHSGDAPLDGWVAAIEKRLTEANRLSLRRVINATGVVLHTNLGRAPLHPLARQAMDRAAGYSTLELEVSTGERGSRQDHVRMLLQTLTGAEDVLVVNNAARPM